MPVTPAERMMIADIFEGRVHVPQENALAAIGAYLQDYPYRADDTDLIGALMTLFSGTHQERLGNIIHVQRLRNEEIARETPDNEEEPLAESFLPEINIPFQGIERRGHPEYRTHIPAEILVDPMAGIMAPWFYTGPERRTGETIGVIVDIHNYTAQEAHLTERMRNGFIADTLTRPGPIIMAVDLAVPGSGRSVVTRMQSNGRILRTEERNPVTIQDAVQNLSEAMTRTAAPFEEMARRMNLTIMRNLYPRDLPGISIDSLGGQDEDTTQPGTISNARPDVDFRYHRLRNGIPDFVRMSESAYKTVLGITSKDPREIMTALNRIRGAKVPPRTAEEDFREDMYITFSMHKATKTVWFNLFRKARREYLRRRHRFAHNEYYLIRVKDYEYTMTAKLFEPFGDSFPWFEPVKAEHKAYTASLDNGMPEYLEQLIYFENVKILRPLNSGELKAMIRDSKTPRRINLHD